MEPQQLENSEGEKSTFTIYEGPIDYYFRSIGIEEGTHISDDLKQPLLRTDLTNTGSTENTPEENSKYDGVSTSVGIDSVTKQDLVSLVEWTPQELDGFSQEEEDAAVTLMASYINGAKWVIQSEGQPIPSDVRLAIVQYEDPEYAKRASHAFYDNQNKTINFNRDTLLLAARAPEGAHGPMSITHPDKESFLKYHAQPHEFHGLEKRLEDAVLEAQDDSAVKPLVELLSNQINEVKDYKNSN